MMYTKIALAVVSVSMMLAAAAQAHVTPRPDRSGRRQRHVLTPITLPGFPDNRVISEDTMAAARLIVADSRERQRRLRRDVRQAFRHDVGQEVQRERRRPVLGGTVFGAIIAHSILTEKARRARRRNVMEHSRERRHPHRRDYGY